MVIDLLVAIAAWASHAGAATGTGLVLLRVLAVLQRDRMAVRLPVALSLGIGLLAAGWQIAAALGVFTRGLVLSTLVIGTAGLASCRDWREIRRWPTTVRRTLREQSVTANLLAAGVVGLVGILGPSALHPAPHGGDAQAFYLAQPKLIASTGALEPLSDFAWAAEVGVLAEMPFAAMYALGSEHAARLTMWTVFVALVAMTVHLTRAVGGGTKAAWLAAAVLATSTSATLVVWDGKTDLVAAMLGVVAIWFGLRLRSEATIPTSLLAGVAGGLSMISKLSLIPVLTVMLSVIAIRELRGTERRMIVAAVTAAVAGGLGVAVLFALKNAFAFGEPLAPFIYLSSDLANPALDQVWYDAEATRWIVATYPLALIFGRYPMQHGNLSPLWLVLVPLAATLWAVRRHMSSLVTVTLAGVTGVAVWVLLRPSVLAPRYILPALIVLIPIAAIGAERAVANRTYLAVPVALASIGFVGIAAANHVPVVARAALYVSVTPEHWDHPLWVASRIINDGLSDDRNVLLGTYSSATLDGAVLERLLADEVAGIVAAGSTDEFWTRAVSQNVQFFLYDSQSHGSWFEDGIALPSQAMEIQVTEHALGDQARALRLFEITR